MSAAQRTPAVLRAARSRARNIYRRYRPDARPARLPAPATAIADEVFVREVVRTGDPSGAVVAVVRELLAAGALGRARTVAQTHHLTEATRAVGDLGLALVALAEKSPREAWRLFGRTDLDLTLRLCAAEYFRAGFVADAGTALATLRAVRTGERPAAVGPRAWLDVARGAFAAGAEDLSLWALDRAAAKAARLDAGAADRLRRDVIWMRGWIGRRDAALATPPAPAGEIPFAVLDYKQPDRSRSSSNLGDPVQTLASLSHLARRPALTFTGDDDLSALARELQSKVPSERRQDGPGATFRLHTADRDATSFASIPDGTWAIVFGWFMHPLLGARFDLPLDDRIRPIFVSVHVNDPAVLTGAAIEYLRRHAPIGCRDHNTVQLLQAAGIPAFFSGCITTTIDAVFPRDPSARPDGTLFVDVRPPGVEPHLEQDFDTVRDHTLTENLRAAMGRLHLFRDTYAQVVTSRLHCYLPSRSIGARVEFRPKNRANVRLDGLLDLSDAEFDRMRDGISSKLAAVLDRISAGCSADEVYTTWRQVCASDVEIASTAYRRTGPPDSGGFDVTTTCARIRAASVTVERTVPGPDAPEINLEFSLDGNLRRQLQVVLGAAVDLCSRPIRAFVLSRDHGPDDHARLARLFPTVSFVWLPTDDVVYGNRTDPFRHITVATMDRLLLPDLLPDVDRIVHHDLDALCLSDPAELFDTDLHGHPLAARTSPHTNFLSGFREFIRASERLDRERANDLIARTHARHRFDFDVFNAGIMVLDLARMRADGFGREFVPYALRFGMNDQAVLNAYAGTDRAALEPGWNWHPRLEELDDPKLAHWAGGLKPWGPKWVFGRELWRAAEARLVQREAELALSCVGAGDENRTRVISLED